MQIHSDGGDSDIVFGYGSSDALTEIMRVKGNGNVGIGIQDPVNKLEVNGSIHTNGNPIYLRGGTSDQKDFIRWASGSDQIEISGYLGVNLGYSSDTEDGTTNILTVNKTGVGIGTANPQAKLDVGMLNKGQLGSVFGRLPEGNGNNEGTFLGVRGYVTQVDTTNPAGNVKSFAIEHGFYGQINSSINFFRGGSTTGGFLTFQTNNNTEQLRIDTSGNVGIGIRTPTAKLHVAGPVIATAYNGPSDKRIKKDFLPFNSEISLETLNQVKIKSFFYKDQAQHGSALHTGVVAQELEDVFPQSVSVHSDFVPDIYSLPASASVNNSVLSITMPAPHNLQTGDMVRFITATGTKEDIITKINDTGFSVYNWQEEATGIFVYGKKVNDYRTVNYNSIFCLGISAIQALHKQLQQLKEEVIILKEKMAAAFVPAL